jgi:hypothetical protein
LGDKLLIQVLALRAHGSPVDGQERKSEVWFEKGIRSPTVEDLFLDPEATLSQIEPSERFNVYYTIAECEERTGRIFSRQYHIPFDVDGIEVPDDEKAIPRLLEPLARVVCAAIGCEYDETAILFSGNGLQFIVGIKDPIEDVEYFDKARGHYRAICDRIDLRLSEHKIEGKADPSVWSRARLMRHPLTQNRKPGKPARWGQILQPNIMRGTFSLEEASGLPTVDVHDQIAPQVARSLFTPDPDEIMSERGCSFLTWAKATPKEVTEPLWYAALSIVGLFPNGRQMAHEISKGHPKYSSSGDGAKAKAIARPLRSQDMQKHPSALGQVPDLPELPEVHISDCDRWRKAHQDDQLRLLHDGSGQGRATAEGQARLLRSAQILPAGARLCERGQLT